MIEVAIRAAFATQATFCQRMGAPVTARVCDALATALDTATQTGRRVLSWEGAPIEDALPLRLVGGLNALAQAGDDDAVMAFEPESDAATTQAALARAIARHDAALLGWLDGPPQTNEAGRAAPLMLGLMAVARRFGQPIELLEIGSSAGFNLLIDRFGFDLGGTLMGDRASPLQLAPAWRGPPPPPAEVHIASTAGVDIAPIDATDIAQAARLRGYVWSDAPERLARMDACIAMLRERPVALTSGDAAEWVEAWLAASQAAGQTRVLMHSVVWQYLGAERQARIEAAMVAAGARATAERPLAWVCMEPNRDLARHEVTIRCWPGAGTPLLLAHTHPHGTWIEAA